MSLLSYCHSLAKSVLCTILCFTISAQAVAHVKWMAEPGLTVTPTFSAMELVVGGSMLLLCVVIAKILNQQGLKVGGIFSARVSDTLTPLRAADYLVAVYLIGCALSGYILAPHIRGGENLVYLCVALQALASILLLINRSNSIIAALLVVLFIIAGLSDPFFFAEYLLLMGIAWGIYNGKKPPTEALIKVLRWCLGLSLITLGFTEKLLQPELAVSVLNQYPLNFMQALGIDFSDMLFVMAAGMVEILVGLLLVMGLLVRTTTLVLLGLMITSNLYFFQVGNYPMAMLELIGHLPVFAIGIMLLFYAGEMRSARQHLMLENNAAADRRNKKYSLE